MRRVSLPYLLLGLVVLVGIYALVAEIEFYQKEIDLGWSDTARRDPFLAAERYLVQHGATVRSGSSIELIDSLPERGVAIIANSTHLLDAARAMALREWVLRGGHLIVGGGDNSDNDVLLDLFQLRVQRLERLPDAPASLRLSTHSQRAEPKKLSERLREANQALRQKPDPGSHKQRAHRARHHHPHRMSAAGLHPGLTQVRLPGIRASLSVSFNPWYTLQQPYFQKGDKAKGQAEKPEFWAGSASGVHLVEFAPLAGRLTVLSDMAIWHSHAIDERDHAYLLGALVGLNRNVQVIYGAETPGLLQLLWRYGPELVVAGGLWLLAWMLIRGRRFGPVLDAQTQQRRALGEHLLASARFEWERGNGEHLLSVVRAGIERVLRTRQPGFEQLSTRSRNDAISQRTGIGANAIQLALKGPCAHETEAFRQQIFNLQTIGRHYENRDA